jgi:hypothetical protein
LDNIIKFFVSIINNGSVVSSISDLFISLLLVNILSKRFEDAGLSRSLVPFLIVTIFITLPLLLPEVGNYLQNWLKPFGKLLLVLLVLGAGIPRSRSKSPAADPL